MQLTRGIQVAASATAWCRLIFFSRIVVCLFSALGSACSKSEKSAAASSTAAPAQILRIAQRNAPSDLDPATASRVLDLLVQQTRETGAALVLVTHSESAARRANRTLHLTAHGFV